jgi:hypothetical protein
MYASTGTRPDITTAVSIVSRFLEKPKKIHCDMARQILYYLRYRPDYGLLFSSESSEKLVGYCDASWANNEDYSSISGFAFLFGKSLITWSSKKQASAALSSTESEYISLTSGTQEALWFQELLNELNIPQPTVKLYEDNQACINIAKNPQEYSRTRHIQVRYHFIRELIASGKIQVVYCPTADQLADLFTKGLSKSKIDPILSKLGIQNYQHGRELNIANIIEANCAISQMSR